MNIFLISWFISGFISLLFHFIIYYFVEKEDITLEDLLLSTILLILGYVSVIMSIILFINYLSKIDYGSIIIFKNKRRK